MNPLDARLLALELIGRYRLVGWQFAFDSARRRFGCCKYRNKVITLSRPLTLLNDQEQVRDTILHEIAHALTPGDGHGAKWRAACLAVGAKPRRCYVEKEVVSPPRKPAEFRYGCRPCGWWVDRRRLVVNRYICRQCGGGLVYEHKATGAAYHVQRVGRSRQIVEAN